jgi:hypothetical protein
MNVDEFTVSYADEIYELSKAHCDVQHREPNAREPTRSWFIRDA